MENIYNCDFNVIETFIHLPFISLLSYLRLILFQMCTLNVVLLILIIITYDLATILSSKNHDIGVCLCVVYVCVCYTLLSLQLNKLTSSSKWYIYI